MEVVVLPSRLTCRFLDRPRLVCALAIALTVISMTSCTKPTPSPDSAGPTVTVTRAPSAVATGPLSSGPTTSTSSGSCPYLRTSEVAADVGQRLEKVTVQHSGGRAIGCTWYPLTHPNSQCDETCFIREKLPPEKQADVKISLVIYASSLAAHNAFIRLAEKGTNIQQEQIDAANTGLCFQTDFWSHDAGKDWACTFQVRTTVALINSVVTDSALNVVTVAQALAASHGGQALTG